MYLKLIQRLQITKLSATSSKHAEFTVDSYAKIAQKNIFTVKEMIGEMGYHRRDTDVKEIEEKLL